MSDFIVGLTGGIGSGKTTVANLFAQLDIDIIDADVIARDVVAKGSPALNKISNHFGADFIQPDGHLDRAMLRKKIFSSEADKRWLNNLLHPLIREQLILQTSGASSIYCLLVVPLLIENNLTALVDRVLVVDVKESTQIARTTQRDKNTAAQVKAIMSSQIAREARQASADDLLNNDDCSVDKLKNSVAQLHQNYLELAKQKG
ncbi:MAG: dephospho-CoA kinase [Colwellia sp.]|nr:dephospho-CoA kinase [Colwellia sp.]MCW9082319.1 dephospho-CoA kinase [Colwellia sp.]